MNLLFTGRGGAGSWTIRGQQIAAALGMPQKLMAGYNDCSSADVIIVVKRTPEQLISSIRKSGKPWIYDIVDAYPQPACSTWPREEAISWLRAHIAKLKPNAIIWPTERMMFDANMDIPGKVIYHHHYPDIKVNPIRDKIKFIGYEGAEHYIEQWRPALAQQTVKRGWKLVINPKNIADLDIVLALRGDPWNGYTQRNWKSNVKLANAHGSGTPFVGAPECGYYETMSGLELFVNDALSLNEAFDRLEPPNMRYAVKHNFLSSAISVETAAKQFYEFACAQKF